MAIDLPEGCPRGLKPTQCQPLRRLDADEEGGFVCCGHLALEARGLAQDRFRFCFKGATTDSMYDHDKRDLTDTISVMAGALSADENREYSGYPEAFWNEADADQDQTDP